jgi:hypothetical protein
MGESITSFSRISLRYPWTEMNEGPELEKQRPPRWDSFPLGYVNPRWDAGVRYWPGGVMLLGVLVLFVGFTIAFGFTNGPLLTAALVASYPILLIAAPMRKRLLPREVGAAASPVPLRVWVLGWLLIATGCAIYPLGFNSLSGASDLRFVALAVMAATDVIAIEGALLIWMAPSWEQRRNRPRRRGRKSRQNGDGASTGTVTLGQPH